MIQLSEKEEKALAAICDALIPSIEKTGSNPAYWQRKASDLNVHQHIVETVSALTKGEQKKFKQLCQTLASPFLLGISWLGPWKAAFDLSLEQRTKLLQHWANSPFASLRNGFSTLKKLSAFLYFAKSGVQETNPNWDAINYPGNFRTTPTPTKPPLNIYQPKASEQLSYDVAIIGSGAGGSVVAAELARAGMEVIIIEKGIYLPEEQMTQNEADGFEQLYEARGALATVDGNMTILAGSCLGGGTTINWAGAFRTPGYVLEEWSKIHHNPHFLDHSFIKGFEYVERRNHIAAHPEKHNPQNQALIEGGKLLNFKLKAIPRNTSKPHGMQADDKWKAEGFSPHGDSYGIKQSAVITFLEDAQRAGAKIICNAEVRKVVHQKGSVNGVEVTYKNTHLNIKCKTVVLAAGSIHSPAVLIRSGLNHKHIGRNLYLHPTTSVPAFYKHKIESWYGPMMSAVCDEFIKITGNYGFKLETPPAHPGLMGSALPWTNGEQFKEDMLNISRVGTFIVLTRDRYGGRVWVDKQGRPKVKYRISEFDKRHLLRGIHEACRIHAAAGAQKISVLHNKAPYYETGRGQLATFLEQIPKLNWGLNRFFLASAHQMGSCRMGGSKRLHPVKPNGETREVKGLYVADASAFPSASGANPMLTTQALAYYVAQRIKSEN